MSIFGYTRYSTAKQEDSAEVQREKITHYARYRFQREPDAFFGDDATCGAVPLAQRPQGVRLLATMEAGDQLVIAKVDRGFRKITDLCIVMDLLASRGITLHLLDISVDTSTETGKAMIRMMGVFAELERARISERTREAMQSRKARGRPTGKPPYGFRLSGVKGKRFFVPNPFEREYGRLCLQWQANGYTEEEIARHLRKSGVKHPRTFQEIHPSSVHRWMIKERILQEKEAAELALQAKANPV